MFNIRANKTTKNADDTRVLFAGIIFTIFILVGSNLITRFEEQRWYRDLTKITPFYDVTLLYSNVAEDSISVQMGGTLIKRRCEFSNLFGYVYGDNSVRYRVSVDTSAEPSGNRPPSFIPESWGPWVISLESNPTIPATFVPFRWEIIAEHIKCPTEPETQRNVFISGDWADYAYLTEEETELEVTVFPERE